METKNEQIDGEENTPLEEGDAIDRALQQMEAICRSRCVQAPLGSNVVVREIHKEE